MTTPGSPDFVLGMVEELRPSASKMSGGVGVAKAGVGHAVAPENVKSGAEASRAVCGQMGTVNDPTRTYHPRGGLAYGECSTCAQRVTASRRG
jgi:hypothetical protein